MEHKGYTARVEYDPEAEILHGQVVNLRDVVTFQGRSVDELKEAFVDSVEDYLEFCAVRGEEPEKPYSGKFVVRVDPAVHRQIATVSALANESLNSWVARILAEASSLAQTAPVSPRKPFHYIRKVEES